MTRQDATPTGPMVAVAGMPGAGKSTLVNAISKHLGWRAIPETKPALESLVNLFRDPDRWAFEAQVSFLADKALQLLELRTNEDGGLVIDRTLQEDADIFAQYFYRKGALSEPSHRIYRRLYSHLATEVGNPQAIVLCRAPVHVIEERLAKRADALGWSLPTDFVSDIRDLYSRWEPQTPSVTYVIDSSITDYRLPAVGAAVAADVALVCEGHTSSLRILERL